MTYQVPQRPIRQKGAKPARDSDYLAKVRAMPCCICYEYGMVQNAPTEAHHCKGGRYGSRKTSDRMAVPLCHSHHNKLRAYPGDEDKVGFHNAQATWESLYGPDTDWISWVEERI